MDLNQSKKLLQINNKEDLQKELNSTNFGFIQEKERFVQLFEDIAFPVTLFIEEYYSDRDYKDSYYHFFASKYRNISKYTHRIAILEGYIADNEIYSKNFDINKIIGVVTIRPFKTGSIGKTLLKPKKLKINNALVRTTNFEIGLFGRRIKIDTFPFSSQDGEYMTCAETALWAILQYYGARYKEYRAALPHEIVNIADDESYQRVSPSHGLNYAHISKVLKSFNFSPQIHICQYDENKANIPKDFKRIFRYYIESGIPLMVGIRFDNEPVGHVVLCIGRSNETPKQIQYETCGNYQIANSADTTDKYLFMDDNKRPFTFGKLNDFNYCKENKEKIKTTIKYFITPLYKRIFLEAKEAEMIFYKILQDDTFGLQNISPKSSKIVIRIFLTTSRNYKASRFETLDKTYKILDRIPMPKFLWICEISTEEQNQNDKVCGEIVLDATASKRDGLESIILLRYPTKFANKSYGENLQTMGERFKLNRSRLEKEFDSFQFNLKEVRNEQLV